jgi:hypothetical protein
MRSSGLVVLVLVILHKQSSFFPLEVSQSVRLTDGQTRRETRLTRRQRYTDTDGLRTESV